MTKECLARSKHANVAAAIDHAEQDEFEPIKRRSNKCPFRLDAGAVTSSELDQRPLFLAELYIGSSIRTPGNASAGPPVEEVD